MSTVTDLTLRWTRTRAPRRAGCVSTTDWTRLSRHVARALRPAGETWWLVEDPDTGQVVAEVVDALDLELLLELSGQAPESRDAGFGLVEVAVAGRDVTFTVAPVGAPIAPTRRRLTGLSPAQARLAALCHTRGLPSSLLPAGRFALTQPDDIAAAADALAGQGRLQPDDVVAELHELKAQLAPAAWSALCQLAVDWTGPVPGLREAATAAASRAVPAA